MYNSILIKWGQSQDKCLSISIDKESVAPILYHPSFTEEFSMEAAASQVGLGPILTHDYKKKADRFPDLSCSRAGQNRRREVKLCDGAQNASCSLGG